MSKIERWHYGCPSGETYIKRAGVTVRRSKNLRGLMRYAVHVEKIETRVDPLNMSRGELRVTYSDGAQGFASFASYHVMIDWVRNRHKWRGIDHTMHGPNLGYFTKPGIIAGGNP